MQCSLSAREAQTVSYLPVYNPVISSTARFCIRDLGYFYVLKILGKKEHLKNVFGIGLCQCTTTIFKELFKMLSEQKTKSVYPLYRYHMRACSI